MYTGKGVCYIHGPLTLDTMLLGQPLSCAHIGAGARSEETISDIVVEQAVRSNGAALEAFSLIVRVGAEGAAVVLQKLGPLIPVLLF